MWQLHVYELNPLFLIFKYFFHFELNSTCSDANVQVCAGIGTNACSAEITYVHLHFAQVFVQMPSTGIRDGSIEMVR